jgi:hypothetical protein
MIVKKVYRFAQLSRSEWEQLELILMKELEMQNWFAFTFSRLLSDEFYIYIQ